jgi:hypothetical protein
MYGTVCDVLNGGACLDGVTDWIKNNGLVIVGELPNESLQFVGNSGDGNGYDGYGYGYGD